MNILVASIIETSIVVSLLLIVVSAGKRISAPVRHALLLIALLKFAVPPGVVVIPFGINVSGLEARLKPGVHTEFVSAAFLVYAAGALFVFLRLCGRLVRLRRLANCASDLESDLFRVAGNDVGIKAMPRLLVTDEPIGPISFGLFRRVVVVPTRLLQSLDAQQLRVVFAHELVHHRRGDLMVSHLQSWLSIIWWFHPIFHLLGRKLEHVREESCDDFLLARRFTTSEAYCSLLLDAASSVSAMAMARHPLDRRIRRIMAAQVPRRDRISMKCRAALIVIALAVLPNLQDAGSSSDSPSPSPSPSPSHSPSPSPTP